MPDFTRGVPYDQEGHKLCVACFRPQLGGTSFACSSCWHELSQINRDEVMRSEVRVNRGQLPRWIINTGSAPLSGSAMPGGMVETKAYDPMCDVADVMARAQGKCDFGAQKELWNYIVGELADRFMRNGKVGADFIHWCHGGSGGDHSSASGGSGSRWPSPDWNYPRLIQQAADALMQPPALTVEGPQMFATDVAARIAAMHVPMPSVSDIAQQAERSMMDRYIANLTRGRTREP